MATTYTGAYKRFNGTDWDTIWFQTSAAQVGESSSRFFIKPEKNTVNGKQFTQNGGITLGAGDIKYGGATLTCVTGGSTLDAAIAALDAGVDAAKKAIPSGVLTTSNYAGTLGSVYQAKNGMLDALSGSSLSADTAVVYDGSKFVGSTYEALAGKLNQYVQVPFNNVMLKNSETVWVYADDIPWDETHGNTSVQDVINNVRELALGRTKSVVLTNDDLAVFNAAGIGIKVPKTSSTSSVEVKLNDFANVHGAAASAAATLKRTFNALKVGDIVYTEPTEYKDWWVSAVGDDPDASGEKIVTLSQFDADSVTVNDSYSAASSVAISGKGVAAALGTLDVSDTAVSGQYVSSVKETDGKISVTRASLPTSLPASNTTSTYSSTGTDPVNGKAVNQALSQSVSSLSSDSGVQVSLGGTVQEPRVTVLVTEGSVSNWNTHLVSGGKVYNYVNSRATKVFCQADAPTTGVVTGDIWIDI